MPLIAPREGGDAAGIIADLWGGIDPEALPRHDLFLERVLIELPGIVAVARRLWRRRRLAQAVALVAPLSRRHLRKRLVADVDPRQRVGETFLCEGLAYPLGPVFVLGCRLGDDLFLVVDDVDRLFEEAIGAQLDIRSVPAAFPMDRGNAILTARAGLTRDVRCASG